jgi:hypothetical protein
MFSDGSNREINKAYQRKSGRPKYSMHPSGNNDAGTISKIGMAILIGGLLINRCKIYLKHIPLGNRYYLVQEDSFCPKCFEVFSPYKVADDGNPRCLSKKRMQYGSNIPVQKNCFTASKKAVGGILNF